MSVFLKVLRALVGAVLFSLAWALFAWLSSGHIQGAISLSLISLVLAPLLIPDLIFVIARMRKRLTRFEFKEASVLRDLLLQCVLRETGLRPRIWILDAGGDNGIQWFEQGWGRSRRQDIIISKAWIAGLPDASRVKEFRSLWSEIAAMSPSDRRIRSFEFRLWLGAFWMLDVLFDLLHLLMARLGLKDMPHPAFWCQRYAWGFKRAWFGIQESEFSRDPFLKHAPRVDTEPLYWKSWVFGVWSRYPTRCLHPAWRVLVENSGLIES